MKDLKDLENAFDRGLKAMESRILEKHARLMGQKVVREVKRLTPVDTGTLRRHWDSRTEMGKHEASIVISNDVEYAPDVNYGHRIVRGGKTVGKTKGVLMLEKGIETYKSSYLQGDLEAAAADLKGAMK